MIRGSVIFPYMYRADLWQLPLLKFVGFMVDVCHITDLLRLDLTFGPWSINPIVIYSHDIMSISLDGFNFVLPGSITSYLTESIS